MNPDAAGEQSTAAPHAIACASLYSAWKRDGAHFKEYSCEFLGTALIVFAVVGFVALMFSDTSPMPRIVPSMYLRLFCAGFLIGSTGSLFTICPLGRLSGAHINPAMTLGFSMLGKMHRKDVAGYIIAQMTGALVGVFAAKGLLGAAAQQVHQAALAPPPGVTVAICFWTELAATFAYCYGLFWSVSNKKTMRFTPLLNVALAACLVCADGHISGAGMNPARWFGPAVATRTWALSWLYGGAPLLAAVLAVGARQLAPLGHRIPHTGKLFHDPAFRSIFKHDREPSSPPAHVAQAAGVDPSVCV